MVRSLTVGNTGIDFNELIHREARLFIVVVYKDVVSDEIF